MNIYVGNLALEITADELRQEFVTFGQVMSVSVMNNKYIGSGQSRGYAFVEMALKSEGETAIASLRGRIIRDLAIDVVAALPLSDNGDSGLFHSARASRFNKKRRQR